MCTCLQTRFYNDYALMKVLYMLRFWDKTTRVHAFKWEDPLSPVDFSGLEDNDMIFIVGHGLIRVSMH